MTHHISKLKKSIYSCGGFISLAAFMIVSYSSSSHKQTFHGCEELSEFDQIEKKDKVLKFVINKNGSRYLFKQLAASENANIIKTVAEMQGFLIAQSIGIPTNIIEIIPSDVYCRHKLKQNYAATLHSFIQAEKMAKFKPFHEASIKQNIKLTPSIKECGLSLRGIRTMSKYPKLAPIAALDTFIGNFDRHKGNILYSPLTNTFYAIDHSVIFKNNLAKIAIKNLKTMMSLPYAFTKEERHGLTLYRASLINLIEKNSPEILIGQFDALLKKALGKRANATSKISVDHRRILETAKVYKRIIQQNFSSCIELVDILTKILPKTD